MLKKGHPKQTSSRITLPAQGAMLLLSLHSERKFRWKIVKSWLLKCPRKMDLGSGQAYLFEFSEQASQAR